MKVLVTRPRDRSATLCALLDAAGLEPVCLPVVETQPVEDLAPLDAAIARATQYDWIVFASGAAARLFGRRAQALDVPVAEWASSGRPRIVTGPSTAADLARHGISAEVVAPFSAANGLAWLETRMRAGQRALLPRGEQGSDTLATGLRAHGLHVEELVLYRTVHPSDRPDPAILLDPALGAVTFLSPSAVAGLETVMESALASEQGTHLKRTVVAGCIGPTSASAARAARWQRVVTPATTTAAALCATLVAHLTPAREAMAC